MKVISRWLLQLALVLALTAAAAAADTAIISSDTTTDERVPVVVRGIALAPDGTVSGVVVNTSANPVRDPRVMVHYQWLWADERNPGTDNPGFTEAFSLQGEIPPGGKAPFRHTARGGLPDRRDGHFTPDARVTTYTEVMMYDRPASADAMRPAVVSEPVYPIRAEAARPEIAAPVRRDDSPQIMAADTRGDGRSPLVVQNISMSADGTVNGVLVNRSSRVIRDPEVLVQYEWLWSDEFRPGGDNPGWTDTVTLRGEIPPGGSKPFVHVPAGGLPRRSDGHFQPEAKVLSFTEVMEVPGS